MYQPVNDCGASTDSEAGTLLWSSTGNIDFERILHLDIGDLFPVHCHSYSSRCIETKSGTATNPKAEK